MTYYNNNILEKTTYYFGNYEKIKLANGDITELHYIAGGDGLAAIHVITTPNNQQPVTNNYYTYTDHLGSITTLTDQDANIVYEQNFDAWGRERNPDTWDYTNATAMGSVVGFEWLTRGYTGHEHLAEFGLINMNGRLYDPILARMLSPDNYVQDATSTQGYNRYSYVVNNPLKYTDPTGDLTWNDVIAGAAIVAGVAIIALGSGFAVFTSGASIPLGAQLGGSLILSGVTHFGVTLAKSYNDNISWDEASNDAGFQFSTTINTDWNSSKKREPKDFDLLPPPPPLNEPAPYGTLLASNNGYLGTEGESGTQTNNDPIRVEANSETPFGPGQIHDQIINVSASTIIEFNNLGNPDKVVFLGIDNSLLGTVRNGNFFPDKETYTIGVFYENPNLAPYFENNTSIIVRVIGGRVNPTAFYYDIYNGSPIGSPNIYTPQVDFTKDFNR